MQQKSLEKRTVWRQLDRMKSAKESGRGDKDDEFIGLARRGRECGRRLLY
jgi:hypothetical protein